MIRVQTSGSFDRTLSYLTRAKNADAFKALDGYGRRGVEALSNATPVDTGDTAASWRYRIIRKNGFYGIEWYNTNIEGNANVAILIQYGHGTGTGGYVQGRDYINPAMRPLFDQMANDIWRRVTAL